MSDLVLTDYEYEEADIVGIAETDYSRCRLTIVAPNELVIVVARLGDRVAHISVPREHFGARNFGEVIKHDGFQIAVDQSDPFIVTFEAKYACHRISLSIHNGALAGILDGELG